MGLMEQIQADILAITTNSDDFGVALEFTSIDGSTTVTVNGIASSHHLRIDFDGAPVAGRNVSISVAEAALVAVDFPTRNAGGDIKLRNCTVKWTDATGTEKTYLIDNAHPDDTLGLIVCILKDKA